MQKSFNQVTEASINYIFMQENILLEDRLQYLKDNTRPFDISHDTTAEHKDHSAIIDHFASVDPSPKKKYTQYILGLYKSKAIRQEDGPRISDAISNFDKYKHLLPADKRNATVKNYPTTKSMRDAVAPHIGTAVTHAEKRESTKQNLDIPGKHELKYDDDHISIYHLKDKETSQKLYGRKTAKNPGAIPTEWCTASEGNHCMFDRYHDRGNLFVVHRKSDGEVFQYHPKDVQFMNRDDETISDSDFGSIHKSLHKAWKENPELAE